MQDRTGAKGNEGIEMDDRVSALAMRIFVQMAAQHTVRHGVHESRGQASSLARESFKLAEAFAEEREARSARLASDARGALPA
jgi:hypothetical protein